MNYIDYDYYINDFKGLEMPKQEFNRIVEFASRIIDKKTMQRAPRFEDFPLMIQVAIKKATACQCEKMFQDGGINAINKPEMASESIGDYTYTKVSKNEKKAETINGIEVSPMVNIYLEPTGLLYRGLGGF